MAGPLWPTSKQTKYYSPLIVARITFRKPMSTGREIVVCVGHLHRRIAKTQCPERKNFWDQLAVLCVGGARIVGLDANMALFGAKPEISERGVDMHLCAVHAEYAPVEQTWKWDSIGICVVGPIPDPGGAAARETPRSLLGGSRPQSPAGGGSPPRAGCRGRR